MGKKKLASTYKSFISQTAWIPLVLEYRWEAEWGMPLNGIDWSAGSERQYEGTRRPTGLGLTSLFIPDWQLRSTIQGLYKMNCKSCWVRWTLRKKLEFLKKVILICISSYKRYLSPFLPPACRFLPTCSEYSYQAIRKYGVLRGMVLTLRRLTKCQPFHAGGHDPLVWLSRSNLSYGKTPSDCLCSLLSGHRIISTSMGAA